MIKFTTVTWYSQLLAIALALVIFLLGIYTGTRIEKEKPKSEIKRTSQQIDIVKNTDSKNITGFSWLYEVVDDNADYPKSEVRLLITRADATNEVKSIATVDGSCDEMIIEEELVLNSKQIQCYYAGFGYQFRLIAAGDSYAVQQKEFEEASPDYNPPIAEFVTIMKIN